MKIKNFRRKLSLACGSDDLRPIMQYVYFDNGYAIATDAYFLVKQSLKHHAFTEDEIKIMNGKFIHKDVFNEIFRYDIATVSEKGFTCVKNKVKVLIEFSEKEQDFVEYNKVIEQLTEPLQIDEIGMSGGIIKKINDVSLSNMKTFRFKFFGKNKGIKIMSKEFNEEDEVIILMPVTLY